MAIEEQTKKRVQMNEEYFIANKKITLYLSQSDIDILVYAINHINWNEYDDKNFGGEGIDAACCHLDEFENLITDETD